MMLRNRLMPYLVDCEQGGRWLRSPHQAFPNDSNLFDGAETCTGFMVGDLLVAPVVEQGATARSIYLPDNGVDWCDFWTGTTLAGGETHDQVVDLDSLPIFVPRGLQIQYWREPTVRLHDMQPPYAVLGF